MTETVGGRREAASEVDGIEVIGRDDLARSTGIKWTRHGPGVLAAWVADMDLRPPPVVLDALNGLVERNDLGYNRHALDRLPAAFARWQADSHGWEIDPADVRVFCDVLHAIETVLWLGTAPGDGVVLLTPVYPPFLGAVASCGRRLVDVPLEREGWALDPDRLAAAVDDGTRAILLCNPHNPTGRVFSVAELDAITRVAVERDLLIISDEVWADLLHPGASHRPTASLGPEVAARTVTITSASKSFNLAGLRCAVANVGHRGVASAIASLPPHLLGAVGTPGAEATLAAWTGGRPWLDALRRFLTARRDQVTQVLASELPAIGFTPPEATYLAWLDLAPLGLGDDPAAPLLAGAGVGLSPGPDFGDNGRGFARLNFATSDDLLDQILRRIVGHVSG